MTNDFFNGPFLWTGFEACLCIGEGIEGGMEFFDLPWECRVYIVPLRGTLYVIGIEGSIFIWSRGRNLTWHF